MIETATADSCLVLLDTPVLQETVVTMLKDNLLKHVIYEVGDGSGDRLIIVNASKALHTPIEVHHLLAKGIVFAAKDTPDGVFYELVCLPFTKFYNGFEGPPLRDIPEIAKITTPKIVRKMDGTLISRWVYKGKVYFSTRGRILDFEKNEFFYLVMDVIEKKRYDVLLEADKLTNSTLMLELVGPRNVIIELHPEDDMIVIGVSSHAPMGFLDVNHPMMLEFFKRASWNLTVVEVYDGNDPEEIIKAFKGIQEGVIVKYVSDNGVVKYHVKYKQEEYLQIVRAKNVASAERLYEHTIEKGWRTFDEAEQFMLKIFETSGYTEELIEFYRKEWPAVFVRVTLVRDQAYEIYKHKEEMALIEVRKDRFLKAAELLDQQRAGLLMQVVDGKMMFSDLVKRLAKKG